MRIACPSCNAAYQVPDERVANGRVVRCARCGTEWAPAPTPAAEHAEDVPAPSDPVPPAAIPPAPVEPAPPPPRMVLEDSAPVEPPPEPPAILLPAAEPTPAPHRSAALMLAWIVSLLAVGGVLATLALRRDDVMQAWPPSTRAFVALGLAPRP